MMICVLIDVVVLFSVFCIVMKYGLFSFWNVMLICSGVVCVVVGNRVVMVSVVMVVRWVV